MMPLVVPSQAHRAPQHPPVSIWGPKGDLWAWGGIWQAHANPLYGRILVVKRLNLGHTLVLRQSSAQDVPKMFSGCCISAQDVDFLQFSPLGGSFRLWFDGSASCENAIFLLERPLEATFVRPILEDARNVLTQL